MFNTEGFANARGVYRTIIDTLAQRFEANRKTAKMGNQLGKAFLLYIFAMGNAKPRQSGGGYLADTVDIFNGQVIDKYPFLPRLDDKKPVWLLPFTGHLGEKLVG